MIPKIIHFCWLSNDLFPKKIQRCIDSWKKQLPDYKIVHWNTENFDIHKNKWTEQAFQTKNYAFVADYVRFYALYTMGGIYLDSDVEVLSSFDNLLKYKSFFGYEYTGVPEAAVVGAEKGTLWLKNALDWYDSYNFQNTDGSLNKIIAPLIMKYAFEKSVDFKLCDDEEKHEIDGNIVLPYEYFSPKNGFTGMIFDLENTICIHHFGSAWLRPGVVRKIKKTMHILAINIFGKKRYNRFMYNHRPTFKFIN